VPDDKPIKSAYELAMERLKKKDAEEGVQTTPITDEQKAAIAEARSFYGAKIAEQEVLLEARLRQSVDAAEREVIGQELRRMRERYASERESKIEKIRRGATS
jgi:primosomal protein N''